jgi:hypothetical protein
MHRVVWLRRYNQPDQSDPEDARARVPVKPPSRLRVTYKNRFRFSPVGYAPRRQRLLSTGAHSAFLSSPAKLMTDDRLFLLMLTASATVAAAALAMLLWLHL